MLRNVDFLLRDAPRIRHIEFNDVVRFLNLIELVQLRLKNYLENRILATHCYLQQLGNMPEPEKWVSHRLTEATCITRLGICISLHFHGHISPRTVNRGEWKFY